MARWSSRIKTLLKTLLGFVLVFYVFQSKMIDFTSLKELLSTPTHLIVAFLFLSFSLLCCSFRWFLIVRVQNLSQSFNSILSLSMIGNFFNTFMPGSVGGDLIKAWYIAGREPEKRTRAVFSVLIDRILGLSVIVCYSAVTLLFFTQWLNGNHQLKLTALLIWIFSGCCLVIALLFFWPPIWELRNTQKILGLLHKNKRLSELTHSIVNFRNHFMTLLACISLSALSVLGIVLFHVYLGSLLGVELTLGQYFFIIPLALTVSAVPLLPGGIGTGQVAFFTLFKWMGIANPHLGGTLCTLLQVYTILFNCLGGIFYLKSKRRVQIATTQDSQGNLGTPVPCL